MGSLNDKKTDACQVCGDTNKAGWHCGAITCEACKVIYKWRHFIKKMTNLPLMTK